MTDERIEPCPFCGGAAEQSKDGEYHLIRCRVCRAEIADEVLWRAKGRWNRRPALTPTPQEAAKDTTDNDLYYLRCISRRLAEFQEAMDGIDELTIGGEAMADERDWLDDYLDRQTRAISEDSQ